MPRYWEVTQATGGIHLDLCNLDMSEIVQALAIVAAGLDTDFPLGNVPTDPSSITVEVDGIPLQPNPNDGWTYDVNTNTVVFHGNGIPQAGSDIDISYGAATTCP